MPKSQTQRRGEIVNALRRTGKEILSPEDMRNAFEAAGVEAAGVRKEYLQRLEKDYIIRVEGGWRLNKRSKQDGIIIIRVAPSQNRGDVLRGLTAALQQFKPLISMEVEE